MVVITTPSFRLLLLMSNDVQARHFFLGDLDPFPIGVGIGVGLDGQTLAGSRVGNETDDDLEAFQEATSPIGGHVRSVRACWSRDWLHAVVLAPVFLSR
jgi:hypothetical protein